MHVKRQTTSKSLPIPRKGTKYLIVPSHEKENGVTLLIILRDILKTAKTRKEAKKILNSGEVFVNDKMIKKENFSVSILDTFKVGGKSYELAFSNKGKFIVQETTRKEKTAKVIGKKVLKNKRIQLNLLYGRNMITEEKVNIGDSVLLDKNKISKVLSLEKGREAIIFSGKNKGKSGKIIKIENKKVSLEHEHQIINVPVKNIMVVN